MPGVGGHAGAGDLGGVMALIQSGKLRALAVASDKRALALLLHELWNEGAGLFGQLAQLGRAIAQHRDELGPLALACVCVAPW